MCRLINYAGVIMPCWLLFTAARITGQLNEKYVGCFADETDQKLEPVIKNADNLTIKICIQKCYNDTNQTQLDKTFAALSNGRWCSCRNKFGEQLRDQNCNVKCSGAPEQNCGGNEATKFYSLYTVCPVGYFGPICDQLCRCKRHLPCDRKKGNCPGGCDEQWTGMSCNISNIQTQYIGCYGDGRMGELAMDVKNPGGKTGLNKTNNSIKFCIEICSTNKYTYAGMQYGYDCNCGEKYNSYGNKSYDGKEVNCNYPCPANRNQICGGLFANSVYYVCPLGFYGRNCVNRCHCSDGGPCRFNGSCLNSALRSCKPGWAGSTCNTRDCKVHNGDCGIEHQCETIDLGYANITACQLPSANSSLRQYIGCYLDTRTRAMERKFSWQHARNNTIESCIKHCASHNYTYAGLQYSYDCFCGNSYDRYGQLPESRCSMKCTGNNNQNCGGLYANSVYAVDDISPCSSDKDCKSSEACSVSDLHYMNISRCQCKQGFHRMREWELCTDVDECKSGASSCNPTSESCVNSIGSYGCECKDGFVAISGKCEVVNECQLDGPSSLEFNTIGIILGTLLAISLLVNALLVISRIHSAKSRHPEPGGVMTQSDFQPSSIQLLNQHEINQDGIQESVDQNNIYEHIILEQRRIVINPTSSEYAELVIENDYVNAESSV